MKASQQEIESALRAAPKSAPPAGLRQRLIAQVRLPQAQPALSSDLPLRRATWLGRWWPVLAPASVSLACAVGLTVQQIQIRDLKRAIREMPDPYAANASAVPTPVTKPGEMTARAEAAARTQSEIDRLKGLAAQLAAEIAQLEQLQAENVRLRAQLAAPPPGLFSAEETEELAKAKEKADLISCVNNLKQVGLAVRLWALDNGEVTPPDIICMSNELNTPKILVCPADPGRVAAKDWNSFSPANCSYEYLAPAAPDDDALRVMIRCPIHGTIGLIDGSVQAEVARRHPERLVQRDGKLYFIPPRETPEATPAPQSGNAPPGDANP